MRATSAGSASFGPLMCSTTESATSKPGVRPARWEQAETATLDARGENPMLVGLL